MWGFRPMTGTATAYCKINGERLLPCPAYSRSTSPMENTPDRRPAPAVSVIIPAYNVAPYIADAVGSVFKQTFRDFEVIVINDGSPDTPQLEQALKPFMDRIRYLKQENKGASAARNTGIKAAAAPLVAMLDGDDIWEPHYLEVQVEQLATPGVVLAYGNTLRFGEGVPPNSYFMDGSPSEGEVTYEKLVRLECNVNTSVTARRDVLIAAGMYDENIRTAEDFDLWLRVAKLGGRIVYTRRVLLNSRTWMGSLSSNQDWMHQDFITVLKKHEKRDDLTPAERVALADMQRKYLAQYRWMQGKQAFYSGDARKAIERLREANEYYRSWKLRAAILLLHIAPGLLLRMYRMRQKTAVAPAR